jgi:hypothetical protein
MTRSPPVRPGYKRHNLAHMLHDIPWGSCVWVYIRRLAQHVSVKAPPKFHRIYWAWSVNRQEEHSFVHMKDAIKWARQ